MRETSGESIEETDITIVCLGVISGHPIGRLSGNQKKRKLQGGTMVVVKPHVRRSFLVGSQ